MAILLLARRESKSHTLVFIFLLISVISSQSKGAKKLETVKWQLYLLEFHLCYCLKFASDHLTNKN